MNDGVQRGSDDPGGCAVTLHWHDFAPADAVGLDLSVRLDITAPVNESGERCPWPWDPQQRVGAPIGMYHCPYCGAMVIAGLPHVDYSAGPDQPPASDVGTFAD
jgi:hypothetical protein